MLVFEGKTLYLYKLRDMWIYYFETNMLGNDIIIDEDFVNVIITLITL